MTHDDVVVGAGTAGLPRAHQAPPSALGRRGDLGAAWAPATPRISYDHESCLTPRTVQLRLRSRVPRLLPGAGVMVDGVLRMPALVLRRAWDQRLGRAA